jgi:hypothetical protein
MTLILIRGDVGSGKTLLATLFALSDERRIRANYKITGKVTEEELLEPEDLNHINEATLAIIDEAWDWLEARLSGRPINLYLSRILFLSRKKRLDLVLTAQLEGTIDKRFRQMANFTIDCQATSEGFLYEITQRGRRPYYSFLPLEVAEEVYPFYDTWEETAPMDDELTYKVTSKTKQKEHVETVVDEMLAIAPAAQWTQGTVEAFFLEKRYSHAEAKHAFQALKLRLLKGTDRKVTA